MVAGVSAYDEKTCGLKQNSDGLAASIFTWSGTYFDDEGNDAILLCRTTGNPAPKVTWFDRYNEPITTGTDYHVIAYFINNLFCFFFDFIEIKFISLILLMGGFFTFR